MFDDLYIITNQEKKEKRDFTFDDETLRNDQIHLEIKRERLIPDNSFNHTIKYIIVIKDLYVTWISLISPLISL